MESVIQNRFAEKVPDSEICVDQGNVWYISHHGVYHPKKPGKIRIVFDCSATFSGESLNDHLLQGPDLTNCLLGVLCKFRQEPIALMCDVEQMFHQFGVNQEHRDFLRFLWWDQGDCSKEPTEYRMNVHLFGSVSSPACANFGFKRIADDNKAEFGEDAANFVRRNFYVDDGLKSTSTVEEAVCLIEGVRKLC